MYIRRCAKSRRFQWYISCDMNRKYVRGTFSTPKAAKHRFSKSRRLENEIAKRCNNPNEFDFGP